VRNFETAQHIDKRITVNALRNSIKLGTSTPWGLM